MILSEMKRVLSSLKRNSYNLEAELILDEYLSSIVTDSECLISLAFKAVVSFQMLFQLICKSRI